MVIDFLTSAWYNRVAAAVNTACAFVSSIQNGASKGEMPQVLGRLLPWIIDILGQLQGESGCSGYAEKRLRLTYS